MHSIGTAVPNDGVTANIYFLWDVCYVCKPKNISFSVCARCTFCIYKIFNLWLKPT